MKAVLCRACSNQAALAIMEAIQQAERANFRRTGSHRTRPGDTSELLQGRRQNLDIEGRVSWSGEEMVEF